jgi:exonuclease SbcC
LISSIELFNFQSHKRSLLEFHPGVNAITGESNNGKTAILRALNWIIYNRPSGIQFVSDWNRDKKGEPVKPTTAKIIIDGIEIKRRRTPEFNGYVIGDKKLEAIGLSVPDEINNALKIGEVNIKRQFDQPFMLADSAQDVGRFLNKEIRLDLIDSILSDAESKRKSTSKSIKVDENKLTEIDAEINTYNWIEKAKPLLDTIEVLEERISNNKKEMEYLSSMVSEYDIMNKKINEFDELINNSYPIVKRIESLLENVRKNMSVKENLISYNDQYNESIKKLEMISYIDEYIQDETKFGIIETSLETIKVKRTEKEKLEMYLESYQEYDDKIKTSKIEIAKYEKQLPKTCPLCGADMTGDICD